MLRTINLHGELADCFGRSFSLDVASVSESVRALCTQLRGFRQVVARGEYHVLVGGAYLNEDELSLIIDSDAPVDIIPVPAGSKNNGWIKVILGIALLSIGGMINSNLIGGIFAGKASAFFTMGAGMMLNGIALMISPTPTLSSAEKPEDTPSYIFGGALNITEEGNCIPLCYGSFLCGSLVISSGLTVEDYSAVLEAPSVEDATYKISLNDNKMRRSFNRE